MPLKRFTGVVAIALTLLAASIASAAQKVEGYLLAGKERAAMRGFVGQTTNILILETAATLRRLFGDIGGATRGRYYGRPVSFSSAMFTMMSGPSALVEEQGGRFLFAEACRHHSCQEKGAFVVDLTTGHAVLAMLHYIDDAGAMHDLGILSVARKACANDALVRYAETRIAAWMKEVLPELSDYRNDPRIQAGTDPLALLQKRQIETPCRRMSVEEAARLEHPPEPRPPPASPPHRLTVAELAAVRGLVGGRARELQMRAETWKPLLRVLRAVADKRGHYGGNGSDHASVLEDFLSWIFTNEPMDLREGRFLLVGGCPGDRCSNSARMILDLSTGDLALSIIHSVDANGLFFYEGGKITTFMASCAAPEFTDFVKRSVPIWGGTEVMKIKGGAEPPMERPATVLYRCG